MRAVDRCRRSGPFEARAEIFEFIEAFLNQRRHSALGYQAPCYFEAQHAVGAQTASLAA